jgi:anti-sigma regulatory factor (Ser/Thr protein kinase)
VRDAVNSGGRSVLSAYAPIDGVVVAERTPPWLPHGPGPLAWSMHAVSLPAALSAPHSARHEIRGALAGWGVSGDDSAVPELLASELVTNGVLASQGSEEATVTVALWRLPGLLVIEVSDQSPHLPELQAPDLSREGGRGLALVEGLSLDWGCYQPVPGRKTVYCVTSLPVQDRTAGAPDDAVGDAR